MEEEVIHLNALAHAALLGFYGYFVGRSFLRQSGGIEGGASMRNERSLFVFVFSLLTLQSILQGNVTGELKYYIEAILNYVFMLCCLILLSTKTQIFYRKSIASDTYQWRTHSLKVLVVVGIIYGGLGSYILSIQS